MKIRLLGNNIHAYSLNLNLVLEDRSLIKSLSSNSVVANIEDASRILKFNKKVIILNSLNQGYLISGNQFINDRIIECTDKYILTYSKSPQTYSVYNANLECLFSRSTGFGRQIHGNYVVMGIGDSKKIIIRNIDKNKIISEFPLSTLGTWIDGAIEKPYQVATFSGIYENTLVCNLNSGAVLLLDIQNSSEYTLLKEARFPRKMFAKKNEPTVYSGLLGRRYIEIDIVSKKLIKEISIEQQLRKIKNIPDEHPCWFSVGFSVLYDDLFYFLCDTNFLGVFDPTSEKIIDYHEFQFDEKQYQQLKGGEENLQVKDGKVYCLDTLGNLYELER